MTAEDTHARLMEAGLNMIGQALSIYDSELRLAVCNRQFALMFDLPEALTRPGTPFEDTIRFLVTRGEYGPVTDLEEAVRLRVAQARTFAPHYMERARANGRTIAVEGAPLAQGGWVTVYTDITEIKRQEGLLRARSQELSVQVLDHAERLAAANRELGATNAALAETQRELTAIEARTRQVTEMMPAHIAHVDRGLIYTFSNRKLPTVMPGAVLDPVGRHASETLGADTFARLEPGFLQALAGEANVREITHTPSGRRVRVALTPDRDAAGEVAGVYILSTDVTHEAQARAALAQSAKRELAGHLTSGLAHDFANLLTVILGLQGRLARLPDLPPAAAEIARGTLAAARRGGTLLDRIAAISGRRVLRPEAVELRPLVEDIAAMARPTLGDAIRLETFVGGLDRPVLVDPGQLQDSLLNLLLNARDAMGPRGGKIRVELHPVRDTWVEISVTDTGPGFSAEALSRGLDPFFTTKGGEGSGLGLSMVYDQTKLAGGTVQLENTEEGACVTLRLPLRPAGAPAAPMLVLLVEDNDDIRANVREMLRGLGHTVIEAASVAEAEALSALPDIGLVLSDIQLPGEATGVELAQRLAPRLPVVLMTSLPPGDPLRASAPCAVLQKPFSARELAALIDGARR
ncbi:PAS-domain containing protein [Paenirhodobacter hankyongi]|uniref:histidine kinase n=1 Tax=Paenirhodobacter hankyongi TaxID=2294033 RepID=A0A421BV92_9RHOB|nr:PAS-domain containing protein [Sinirhodobacter hankyongi]RLL72228.1 response regulator [Sinirhodobacter hankyongi]